MSDRERFEEWAVSEGYNVDALTGASAGRYVHRQTHHAWLGFQAALSSRDSTPTEGVGKKIVEGYLTVGDADDLLTELSKHLEARLAERPSVTNVSRERIEKAVDKWWKTPENNVELERLELINSIEALQLPAPGKAADDGWINVNDQMPEVGKMVLVTQVGSGGHDVSQYEERLWKATLMESGDFWTSDTMLPSRVYGVINWQPLPKAPK